LGLLWSYPPPLFSLEAHPTANNPVIAVNAINFFIITPFSDQPPLNAAALNQAFTHKFRKNLPHVA
jgi:hypothetical protein